MRHPVEERATYVLSFLAGAGIAAELSGALGACNVPISGEGASEAFSSRWSEGSSFIFVGALAAAVRSVAPLLRDELSDPALVVVSEDGEVSIPVISGRVGFAADLARECAEILSGRGAVYVPTTAGDREGCTAPDLWAARRGYAMLLKSGVPSLIMKLRTNGEISVWVDPILADNGISLPLPFGYRTAGEQKSADLVISPRSVQKLAGAKPQIVPRVITVGIGCVRGTPEETLDIVLKKALSSHQRGPFLAEALTGFETAKVKEDEEAILRLAESHSLPLTVVPVSEISAMDSGFSPPAASRRLGPRVAEMGVTVGLSISPPVERGDLAVVGVGPGGSRFVTAEARDVIAACDVLIGYKPCVDLLPESWIRRKIVERCEEGEEESLARRAMDYAVSGYRVVLASGGDPTLFGLSSLSLSMLPETIDPERVRIIPGITAVQAAGASIGAPYSNGLVLVSLSDYLHEWGDVQRALEGARESGLTVAVCNPAGRGLDEKIAAVRGIFRGRRVVITRDAGGPCESSREMEIDELDERSIDTRTVMMILPPSSREI